MDEAPSPPRRWHRLASARRSLRRLRGWRPFANVPPKVRRLILFGSPTNVAGGFFFVIVSAYLPELGRQYVEIVGLVLGVSGLTMVLTAVPLGILSDRRGRKTMLIAGSATFSPILLVFALTRDPAILVLMGLLSGVAQAAFLSTWNALIADGTPLEHRNSAFAMSFVVGTTTSGMGFAFPLVFPALEGATGLDPLAVHQAFLVIFGLLALATPASFALLLRHHVEIPRPRRAPGPAREPRPPLGRAFLRWARVRVRAGLRESRVRLGSHRLLLRFSLINSFIGLGAGFIIPLIPTWLFLKFGVPDSYSGPLLAVSNIAMGLAGFVSAGLASRYGSVRAAVLTQSLSTGFMVSLAFIPDPALAGGLYVVRAALMNMASPILDSYLMSIIAPEERGFASAVNSIIWRLPNSISTVLGGIILAAGHYDVPFLIATAFYVIGISTFYAAFRNVRPGEAGAPAPAP